MRARMLAFLLLVCPVAAAIQGQTAVQPQAQNAISENPGNGIQQVTLGNATVALTGPWKFHTGDNMAWAQPGFDDSTWSTMDLTPLQNSYDPFIGSSGYVPGWTARGYQGLFRLCLVPAARQFAGWADGARAQNAGSISTTPIRCMSMVRSHWAVWPLHWTRRHRLYFCPSGFSIAHKSPRAAGDDCHPHVDEAVYHACRSGRRWTAWTTLFGPCLSHCRAAAVGLGCS